MNKRQLIKILVGAIVAILIIRLLAGRWRRSTPTPTIVLTQAPNSEKYEAWAPEDYEYETLPPSASGAPSATAAPGQQATLLPGPIATSVQLLPKTSPEPQAGEGSWAEFAPQSLQGQQLLDPVKFIGVDTQGSTLKNASWDIRRSPPIARTDVGPFLNSSYEADPWRKPLDDCN